jgi:DNA-binding NarL/FixJ family response regulator
MPGINGIEAARRIVEAHPDTMVVLVSTYQVSDLPTEAETSGASGYLNKEDLTPRVVRRLWEERHNGGWRSV